MKWAVKPTQEMEILLDDSSSGGEDDTSDVSSVLVKGDPEDLVDEDDDEVEDPSDDGGPEIVKVGIGPRYLTLTSKSVTLNQMIRYHHT